MSYYGAGDYYGAGGFGSFLRGAARIAGGFIAGGPVGAAAAGASLIASSGGGPKGGSPVINVPGPIGAIQRALPGGKTGLMVGPDGTVRRRSRRMNFANGKALTRANRRVDGFVRLAKRSLKHTNYKIVSKSSGTRRRSSGHTIIETGPGSVRA